MKKLIVLSAAVIITAAVTAQTNDATVKNQIKKDKQQESIIKKEERKELRKLEGKEVSYQAKLSFYTDFGDIPGTKWERMDNFDKATFKKGGNVMSAYYDYYAKLVGTTSRKSFADIPAKAQKFINKKYAGYNKSGVIFFDDNEYNESDMILYGQQFDDADNYFVELQKGGDKIVLQVNMAGNVLYFTKI